MTQNTIGILIAASDLAITHEEAESVMMKTFGAAVTCGVLAYMIYAFGKGIGLKEKESEKFAEMVKEA